MGNKVAESYDDNFLDHFVQSDSYKQWSKNPKNKKLATTNAFDQEKHRVNFDSSNQDEVREGTNPFLNQFVDLNSSDPYNELRADNQTGLEQVAKLIPRAATKALAEIAKLPGVIGGLIAAPFAKENEGFDTVFNNPWIKTIDEINDKINTDLLPVYTKKAVETGNLWDNISSTSFWATDGADGLGFILGMMAPGAAFESLGLGSKMIEAASNSSRLARFTSMAGKAEEGVNALKLMGMTGKNIDSILAVTSNTIFEAGAEAKGVGDDLDRKKPDFIKSYIGSKEHQTNVIKKLQELDQQRKAGLIDIDTYNKLSSTAAQDVAEEKFKEQRALAMRDTFVSNVGILIGPNALMHKAIWGKAAEKFEKTAEQGFKGLLNRAGKSAGRIGKAFASEGFWEEGSQTTVENMYVNKAMQNKLGKDLTDDFSIGDFTKEYVNTVSSTNGQKAIFLGGALGGPMMSYQGRKEDVKNRKHTNEVLDNINKSLTKFNTVFENDIYQKNEDGSFKYKTDDEGNPTTERLIDKKAVLKVAKDLNYTEFQSMLLDHAIETGNKEVVEKIKQEAIFDMIMPAIHNGELGIKALEQKLNEDSKFQELIAEDQKSNNKNKTKDFVKETLETAKYLQEQNDKFKDFSKDVIELKNDKATPEQKQTFLNKLNASYLFTKHNLRQNEKSLKELEDKKIKLLDELNINPELNSTDILDNGRLLQDYKTKSPLLTKTLEEINSKKEAISKAKKDIADIWQGKLINDSFDSFIEEDNKESETVSDENVAKADKTAEEIKKASSTKELTQIKTDNPIQQKEIEVKKQELQDQEEERLAAELESKKSEEDLIKNQDLSNVQEMDDIYHPITGKPVIVTQIIGDDIYVQDEDGNLDKIKKPKVETEDISSNEETEVNKEENEDLSSKSNFGLPSKFNETFKSFVDFMMKPFDKKGLKTSFELNTENLGTNSQKAVQIYNEAINGKKLSAEDKNILYNWLPLTINIDDNKSWSGYPGGKGDYSNAEAKFTIRKNIVDAIAQGISLENINGVVAGQSSPNLNCEFKDSKPVKNNVLGIDYIKELTNNGEDLSKLEIYHVDNEGKLIPVSEGAEINPSAKTKELLSTGKGNIYVTIKGPLGNDVPVKLNFSRLGEQLTVPLLDIYKHILTHADTELLYTQSLSDLGNEDSQFYDPILYENLKTKLKGAIKLLGDKENEITLEQLIETLVLEDSGSNSHLKIVEDENGKYALEFKEGNRYYLDNLNDPETLGALTKDIAENKYRNIITIPNKTNKTNLSFKNNEYVKYIFDTKGLTTNVSTTSHSFKTDEAGIWLEPGVIINQEIKSKPQSEHPVFDSFFGIEAKKADIEKRRQEELNSELDKKAKNIPVKKEYYKDSNGNDITVTTYRAGNKTFNFTESNNKAADNFEDLDLQNNTPYKIEEVESKLSKKINAKYDAELAALGQTTTNNNQTDIERIEIPRYFTFGELGGKPSKKAGETIETERNAEIQENFEKQLKEGDKLIEPNGDVFFYKNGKVVKPNGQPRGLKDIGAFINGVTIERNAELVALESKPEVKNDNLKNGEKALILLEKLRKETDPIKSAQIAKEFKDIILTIPLYESYIPKNELNTEKGWAKYLFTNDFDKLISGYIKENSISLENKPEQTNAFGTNPNFKSTKIVMNPETGETFEVEETLEDLQKQLQEQIENRDKTPLKKLKDIFNIKIQETEEKIRNIQKNSVSLQKDFQMEIEKEGTEENKEVKKAKVENTLSKAEQLKEIEQMTQLNNTLLQNPNLPQQMKDKFEELKNKYSDEFNKLPKKCN